MVFDKVDKLMTFVTQTISEPDWSSGEMHQINYLVGMYFIEDIVVESASIDVKQSRARHLLAVTWSKKDDPSIIFEEFTKVSNHYKSHTR